jgi:hypothetical protein
VASFCSRLGRQAMAGKPLVPLCPFLSMVSVAALV